MGRTRHASVVDPATGKTRPPGVCCRGPGQYLARKMVNGRRVAKTFDTAKRASDWIKAVEVDTSRGLFVDQTKAQRVKLAADLPARGARR